MWATCSELGCPVWALFGVQAAWGNGDADRFIPGLLFSGDGQDGEDKTSHELLALRYLLLGSSGGTCSAGAPWAALSLLPGVPGCSGWASWGCLCSLSGFGIPYSTAGKSGCHAGASTAPAMPRPRRLSRELQEKEKVIESLEAKLQERCESPGSSRPPSESSRSATSASFVSDALEPCSDGDAASECSQCREEPARLTGTTGWGRAGSLLQWAPVWLSTSGRTGPPKLSQSCVNTSLPLSPVSRPSL